MGTVRAEAVSRPLVCLLCLAHGASLAAGVLFGISCLAGRWAAPASALAVALVAGPALSLLAAVRLVAGADRATRACVLAVDEEADRRWCFTADQLPVPRAAGAVRGEHDDGRGRFAPRVAPMHEVVFVDREGVAWGRLRFPPVRPAAPPGPAACGRDPGVGR